MVASSAGQAVENARNVHTYAVGMCQKYVRDPCWRVGSLYGSAIEAWNGAADKHPGDRNPPNGAPCYYRGGNYGHAVICVAPGRIRSTDSPTSGNVNDQPLSWPETAWGYDYLGWTGDLNGVDLPLGGGSTPPPEPEDEMPEYLYLTASYRAGNSKDFQVVKWDDVVKDSAGVAKVGDPGVRLGGRRYAATLDVHLADLDADGAIWTRVVEGNFGGPDGAWQAAQTGRSAEFPTSGADTNVRDTTHGQVSDGNRLRWTVRTPGPCDVGVELTVLFW